MKAMTKTVFTVGLLALLMVVPAFGASINKSIKVEAGSESGGATSVNGSITVGADAVVTGGVKTVNGSIRVDSGARIENASTVNGGVRIAENVQADNLSTVNGAVKVGESAVVDGEIEAVNGGISVKKDAKIARDVSNVNGQIDLSGAEVGGDVSTVTGDVNVVDGSVVKGDLIVEKPSNWGWGNKNNRKPRIVIGPGSTVEGVINLEREVELYISTTANVGGVSGVMSMDDAIRFDGNKP
ncbi:MAG: hypothetical protein GWP67_01990 [Gammaproteobacteria bacterium]|jgi:DUF4097 and DUF4098 domain-containing protein YvlB|nr:hypothetical protein [Gammaproteobacteria bacterium]